MARRRRSRKASAEDLAEIRSGKGSARDKAEAGRGSVGRKKANAKFRFRKVKRKRR